MRGPGKVRETLALRLLVQLCRCCTSGITVSKPNTGLSLVFWRPPSLDHPFHLEKPWEASKGRAAAGTRLPRTCELGKEQGLECQHLGRKTDDEAGQVIWALCVG